jgi:hypothetical protein
VSTFFESETAWLNVTNILLGLVTIACIAAVVRVALQEWWARSAAKSMVALPDDTHAFDIAGLGITMADGGVRLDESTRKLRPTLDPDDDPPNIIRSTN